MFSPNRKVVSMATHPAGNNLGTQGTRTLTVLSLGKTQCPKASGLEEMVTGILKGQPPQTKHSQRSAQKQ